MTLSVLGSDGQSLVVTNDEKLGDKAAVGHEQSDKTMNLAYQVISGQPLASTNDDIKEIVTTLELPKVEEEPIKREGPKQSPYVLEFWNSVEWDALRKPSKPKPVYKYRFIKAK